MKYIHLPLRLVFFALMLCSTSLVSNAQSKFRPQLVVGQEIIYDFTNVWSCTSTADGQKITNRFAKCNPSFEEGLDVEKYYDTKKDSVHTSFAVKVVHVSPYGVTLSLRLLEPYNDKNSEEMSEEDGEREKQEKMFEDSISSLLGSHPVLVTYTSAMDSYIVSNNLELASHLYQLEQRFYKKTVKPFLYALIYAHPDGVYLLNTGVVEKGSVFLEMFQTFCPAIELVVDAMRKSYTIGTTVKGKPLDGSNRKAEYQKVVASLTKDGFSQRIEDKRYVREEAFDDSDQYSECFLYDADSFVEEEDSAVVADDNYDFETDTAGFVLVDDNVDTDSIYNNEETPKEPKVIPVRENDRPWCTVSQLRMSLAGIIKEYTVNTTVSLRDAVWVRRLRLVERAK